MPLNEIIVSVLGDNVIALLMLGAIVYLVRDITRLNLLVTETRKEKDAMMREFLERVVSAVERLDLPGPK